MKIILAFIAAVVASQSLGLSIQDGSDPCADCIAFFTDREEMALERINEDENKMNERCSTLEPSKVEECKEKVKKIPQEKKDRANSESPTAICNAIKFCQSLVTAEKSTNKVEGKRRCMDCKNFLNDVKEREMASVLGASVGELIETEFCEKLSEDHQQKCEVFIKTATEKEIELLDLVNVERTCTRLDMCGGN